MSANESSEPDGLSVLASAVRDEQENEDVIDRLEPQEVCVICNLLDDLMQHALNIWDRRRAWP